MAARVARRLALRLLERLERGQHCLVMSLGGVPALLVADEGRLGVFRLVRDDALAGALVRGEAIEASAAAADAARLLAVKEAC